MEFKFVPEGQKLIEAGNHKDIPKQIYNFSRRMLLELLSVRSGASRFTSDNS